MPNLIDPDSPNRCRGTATSGGQCKNEALEGQNFCANHGGRYQTKREMQDYLTEQFERRLKVEADAIDEIKLLRENLMTLNAVIAARRNLMKDESSMLANAGAIFELVIKAEKITVSLHKLAVESGELLAKKALFTWSHEIVKAIGDIIQNKYVGWEDDLFELSNRITTITINAQNIGGKE